VEGGHAAVSHLRTLSRVHLCESSRARIGDAVALITGMNDNLKDKIDNAADKAKDLADKAGEKIEQGADKVADKTKDIADRVKDAGRDANKKVGG
jgi:hypothetical protein